MTVVNTAYRAALLCMLLLAPPSFLRAAESPAISARAAAFSAAPALRSELGADLLHQAFAGFSRLKQEGRLTREGILTVIDFSRPSSQKRLFVIDVAGRRILYSSLVAHGRGSGISTAERFSNEPGSFRSSLGFFTTGATYEGSHGYSLRLEGLEEGVNDNAAMRSIVIHPAAYATRAFVLKHGRLGRSQGCPALPPSSSRAVIDLIKGGSCLFIYHQSPGYLAESHLLDVTGPS
ncbi:murein L,D-transpeptidase catalytic domain family protein [Chlorobium sp. N1]|uniref:murein L,D-transpeptidase catalytic domain family protein n=1 Tax=Chlorobium sp. N1 TaxID=2491138 RepID=UPI00104007BF|nr:murein L,D-transpeptidase catalytic domain family protein [Chlorobium sp. N1]TCD47886.1 murein L,D-transpeptidase catalytic domain family protein [Chlorobium sp. N1]